MIRPPRNGRAYEPDRRRRQVPDEAAHQWAEGPGRGVPAGLRVDLDQRGAVLPRARLLPADLGGDHAVVLDVLRRAEDRLGRPDRRRGVPAGAVRQWAYGPALERGLSDGA